jgi:hypothetical protein
METSTALAIFVGICVLIGIIGAIVRPIRPDLVEGEDGDDDNCFHDSNDLTYGVFCSDIPGNIYHSDDDEDDI